MVDVDDQICVKPGDVIGTQYPGGEGSGVIPYQQSNRSPSIANLELSALVNKNIRGDDLPWAMPWQGPLRAYSVCLLFSQYWRLVRQKDPEIIHKSYTAHVRAYTTTNMFGKVKRRNMI